MHGGIGIENAAPIGGKRLSAFGLWQHVEEIAAEIGIEAREHIGESDFDLGAGTEERRAQNDAGNPIRMGLRIGQRQGRAPGTADHDPALKGELFADPLHIRDQMRQRVVLAAPLGPAAPGAALVEQDRVKTFGIEQPAMIGLAAAAGSAMQIDCSNAVRAADAFDVNLVAVADREHFRGQRRKRIGALGAGFSGFGVRRHGRRLSPASHRRNCDRGSGCCR